MDDPIAQFLNFLAVEKNASNNTIAAYRNDLAQFMKFITGGAPVTSLTVGTVKGDTLVRYVEDLRNASYKDATVARKVAAVKSFFGFLSAEAVVTSDPTEQLKSPQVGKSLPRALTVREVDELLEQPGRRSTPEARRDKAMLELLYATGLRVTELVSLDVVDIALESDPVTVRCVGKGERERVVPIYDHAGQMLAKYLADGRPNLVRDPAQHALFLNHRGERLTRQGLWLIIKHYVEAIGIETEVTPHTLRHSFATHMLHGGAKLRDVQKLLGHANISTTQVYTQVTRDHLREAYNEAHPRA